MMQISSRQRGERRASHVLLAALGAALLLPSFAIANIYPQSETAAGAGETSPAWPGPWSRTEIQQLVVAEAVSNGAVPVPLALAVADVESDFVPRTIGYSGTVGVMQLHPDVAKSEFGADADTLRDPATNIRLGLRWLARLHERYDEDWELALSHYRGGELAKADGRHRAHRFTDGYVQRVMSCWRHYRRDLLVRAWIREANGGPRFVSDEAPPRLEAWSAGTRRWCDRLHAYERHSHDHRLDHIRPVDDGFDDLAPADRPARFRFSDGSGWWAVEDAPRARDFRGGRWVPVTGNGSGRFR